MRNLAFIIVLVCAVLGCRQLTQQPKPGSQPSRADLYAPIPPRTNVDPTVRHSVLIHVPAEIRAKREATTLTLLSDGVVTTSVTVGKNMITGVTCDSKVYRKGALLSLGGWTLQGGFPDGGDFNQVYRCEIDGIPKSGEDYIAEVTMTYFETDLPAQHFWQPRAGRLYRVLWSRTYRAEGR